MTLRRDALALTAPIALCLAVWGVIITRPAVAVRVTRPTRSSLTLPARRTPRAPTLLRIEPVAHGASLPTPAPSRTRLVQRVAQPLANVSTSSSTNEVECSSSTIEWFGEGFDYDDGAWQMRWFYIRRAWRERWAEMRRARSQRVRSFLVPGDASMQQSNGNRTPSLCEVFNTSCGGTETTKRNVARDREDHTAIVRREGRRLVLTNGITEVTLDPEALCAMRFARSGSGTMSVDPVAVPSTTAHCEVRETVPLTTDVAQGGAALSVTWCDRDVWQQAVVSLTDGDDRPEMALTRVEGGDHTPQRTFLVNLSGRPMAWTVGGREIEVAPAQSAAL